MSDLEFLDAERFAVVQWQPSIIEVFNLNGEEKYRVAEAPAASVRILRAAAAAGRFAVAEWSYTLWNRAIHFLDLENSRPRNFIGMRLFETAGGREIDGALRVGAIP
jgi:hypothetical protein